MSTHPAFVGGPTGPGLAAPGPGGYVVAVLVADLVTAVAITLPLTGGSIWWFLPMVLVVSVYVVLASIPVALVCVPLVHVLSRRHPRQWWHVAVTGLVTVGAAVLAGFTAGDPESALPLALVAVATTTGRAALVPAVRRERASRATAADFAPWSPLG